MNKINYTVDNSKICIVKDCKGYKIENSNHCIGHSPRIPKLVDLTVSNTPVSRLKYLAQATMACHKGKIDPKQLNACTSAVNTMETIEYNIDERANIAELKEMVKQLRDNSMDSVPEGMDALGDGNDYQ